MVLRQVVKLVASRRLGDCLEHVLMIDPGMVLIHKLNLLDPKGNQFCVPLTETTTTTSNIFSKYLKQLAVPGMLKDENTQFHLMLASKTIIDALFYDLGQAHPENSIDNDEMHLLSPFLEPGSDCNGLNANQLYYGYALGAFSDKFKPLKVAQVESIQDMEQKTIDEKKAQGC